MQESVAKDRYSCVAIALHWVTAILIIGMLLAGFFHEAFGEEVEKQIIPIHKAVGVLIIAITIFRLGWRLKNPPPELPETMSKWQKNASKITHYELYFLLLAMPLSGWLMSSAAGYPVSMFGLFSIPPIIGKDKELANLFYEAHEILGWVILALIILHTMAGLYHHYIVKDGVLKRMLPACPGGKCAK